MLGPSVKPSTLPVQDSLHGRLPPSILSCSAGAHGIVDSGLISPLVLKLQREEESIQELILDTLASCLQEDATEALSSCAVPFFKQKLLSTNKVIRSKAARALIAIR